MGFSNYLVTKLGALVRQSIHSPDYAAGLVGWTINKDGSAEFNNGTFRGTVTAATIIGSLIENSAANPKTAIAADGSIKITNAAGQVIFQIAPDGTLTWFSAAGAQLMQISPSGFISITDPAFLEFPSGAVFENSAAQIQVAVGGVSPAQFISMAISSASDLLAGARDQVKITFNSANADNSSNANLDFIYEGSNGVLHEYAFMDSSGFNVLAGSITAAHPGTTPAVAETRQSLAAGNGWTGTVFYEMLATGRVEIVAQLTAPASAVNGVTVVTLPAGYRPAAGITFGVAQSAVGNGMRFTLNSDGTFVPNGITASSTVWIGPIQLPLDL